MKIDIEKLKTAAYVYVPEVKDICVIKDFNTNAIIVTDDDILNLSKETKQENPAIIKIRKIIEEQFEPLKSVQDMVAFDNVLNVVEKIPVKMFTCKKHIEMICEMFDKLNDYKKTLAYLSLKYVIEKEIQILTEINEIALKENVEFDALIFRKFNEYLGMEEADENIAKEITTYFANICNVTEWVEKDYTVSLKTYDFCQMYEDKVDSTDNYKHKAKEIIDKDNKSGVKKNVIVFHMESISNEIFNNHRPDFENICNLMNKSVNFTKFYSSATSSAMAISDFLHGNDYEMDRFTNFHEMSVDSIYGRNMYQILADNGYSTMGIGYNYFPATEEVNSHNIWNVTENGEKKDYIWISDFSKFMRDTIKFIEDNKDNNFAMHIWNLMPHVGQKCDETMNCHTFFERITKAYVSLEMTIQKVYECLETNGLLENTIIAGYGDHGDDKWTRIMNAGFTHTTEPYHNIVNTPSFIFDSRLQAHESREIVSLIDLKNTLLYMSGNESGEELNKYCGINIIKNSNDYVYSKRLFVNQKQYDEIKSEMMIKLHNFNKIEIKNAAYAIIGKDYTLLCSNNGTEMFMNQLDPCSYNNILNFYRMDKDGRLSGFDNKGAWRGHFRTIMMQDEQIYDVICNYNKLRKKLIEHIEMKQDIIRKTLGVSDLNDEISNEKENQNNNTQINEFDMSNFNRVRDRGFICKEV